MKKYIWIAVLFLLVTSALCAPTDLRSNGEIFAAERWKDSNARTRGQMVRNLLNQKENLIGKGTVEIIAMLGEPDVRGRDFFSYHFKSGFLMDELLPSKDYVIITFSLETGLSSEVMIADA